MRNRSSPPSEPVQLLGLLSRRGLAGEVEAEVRTVVGHRLLEEADVVHDAVVGVGADRHLVCQETKVVDPRSRRVTAKHVVHVLFCGVPQIHEAQSRMRREKTPPPRRPRQTRSKVGAGPPLIIVI